MLLPVKGRGGRGMGGPLNLGRANQTAASEQTPLVSVMSGQSISGDGGTGIGQEKNDILSLGLTDILTRLKPNRLATQPHYLNNTASTHTLSADGHNVTYFPQISGSHPLVSSDLNDILNIYHIHGEVCVCVCPYVIRGAASVEASPRAVP